MGKFFTNTYPLINLHEKASSNSEIVKNSRSRSAKLRYAVRSKNKFIYPSGLPKKFKNYLDLESLYV